MLIVTCFCQIILHEVFTIKFVSFIIEKKFFLYEVKK